MKILESIEENKKKNVTAHLLEFVRWISELTAHLASLHRHQVPSAADNVESENSFGLKMNEQGQASVWQNSFEL